MIIPYKNGKEFLLDYDDESHSYRVDGLRIPSVTKIVDSCFPKNLHEWVAVVGGEEYKRITEEALTIGNDTHKYIEDFITYGHTCDKPDEHIANPIEAFLEWDEKYEPQWMSSERKIYCDKFKYAGTVDAVAKIGGRVCVIDFKTSKKIYKPYHLQVTAYAQAIKRMDGLRRWPLGIILRLDKETGQYEMKVFEPKAHFQMFLNCIRLRDWSSTRIKNESIGDR